jgi:hypothetical protein
MLRVKMLVVVVLRTNPPDNNIFVIDPAFSRYFCFFFKCPIYPLNGCTSMFRLLRANSRQGHERCTVLARGLRKYIILCRVAPRNVPFLVVPCCSLLFLVVQYSSTIPLPGTTVVQPPKKPSVPCVLASP